MANETIRARIEVLLKGLDQVESLKNAVKQLKATAAPASADLDKLRNAATQLGSASGRTENDLRRSISALKDVRAQLSLTDREYQKLTGTINKYQSQLDRATGAQQRGGRAMQFAQTAGAVAASGVFGGPEGLIGAGIGGILGGPGGALAGGAIGGQVGMFRQQVGVLTTYAADISKLEIALKGVTKTQGEYERALAASAAVTRDFNVPQLEATKGLTQLSAAVIGAGGKVADAEVVFRNVTAAIKASGGTSEDVQGALRALAQTFSKGKVSAEELQGQLGERLPGAVTMFAKATGRTLPQLQKDLEQGVVGLADLMKFVVSDQGLGQFEQRAKAVADSSAEAGARLTTTWNNTQRAIGEALLPLGADLQNAFAGFLEDATPTLVSAARGFVSLAGAIRDAFSAFMDFTAPFREFFGGAIPAYARTVTAFWDSILNDLASFWGRVSDFFGSLRSTATEALRSIGIDVEWLGGMIKAIADGLRNAWSATFDFIAKRWRESVANMINYSSPLFAALKLLGIVDVGAAVSKGINAGTATPAPTVAGGKTDRLSPGGLTDWQIQQTQKEEAEKRAADKARAEAERLAAEQQRLDEAVAKAEIQLAQTVFNNQIELIKKRYDYEQERIQMQRDIWAGTFEGIRSESARAANEFVNRLEQIRQRTRSATLGVVVAEQTAAFNARMEAVTGQGLSGGGSVSVGTGAAFSGQQLQAAAREAARFTGIANMCSESVKAFYKSLGISLPGVTAWADTVRKAGTVMRDWSQLRPGDIVATGRPGDTPHVGVYTGGSNVFHQSRSRGLTVGNYPDLDYFKSGGYFVRPSAALSGRAPAGVAAQTRRNVAAGGRAAGASAEVQQANAMLGLEAAQSQFMLKNQGVLYAQQRTQGLRDEAKAMENNNALLLKRMQLEQAGLRPELIDAQMKIAEIEQLRAEKLAQINENIQQNQYDAEAVAAFRLEIEETNSAYDRQIAAINALAQAQTAAGVALKNRIGQLRQELEQLATMENFIVNMSQTIESSISTAISSAVTGLVTGATSIKQVLADMFRSIGDAFVKMAADIIAKQLIMVALNQLLGLFGGGGGGGFLSGTNALSTTKLTPGGVFATGGVMTNTGPLPLKRYAGGGVAKSPQVAVFGERGPEAYVPLPDGRNIPVKMQQRTEALNRYRPIGATGTITEGEGGVTGGAGGAAGGGAIDVRYTVERINNVEYVTADQFQEGMRQAAAQGAQRGEQRALRSLQQSTAVRNRIGMR